MGTQFIEQECYMGMLVQVPGMSTSRGSVGIQKGLEYTANTSHNLMVLGPCLCVIKHNNSKGTKSLKKD